MTSRRKWRQSNDAIPIGQLFCNPVPTVHKMTAPKKVLLEGQPGIGKSTVAKDIVNQWPWIEYVFLIKLKDQPSHKNCSLSELNGLILADHQAACIKVISKMTPQCVSDP